jgi:ribosomal-protein-alanine N-acetyltransferase
MNRAMRWRRGALGRQCVMFDRHGARLVCYERAAYAEMVPVVNVIFDGRAVGANDRGQSLGTRRTGRLGACRWRSRQDGVSGGGGAYTASVRKGVVNIETSRLILRDPTPSDVPRLFEFLGDAVAMRHTHADSSPRECRRRVLIHEWRRRRKGYAPWTIVTKADQMIIGWGGLYDDPFDPAWGVEIGYFFDPAAWGCGYATELATACTSLADNILHLPEVRAFARPENVGSRRVLEKAGFEVVRFIPEMERFLYRRGRHGERLAV